MRLGYIPDAFSCYNQAVQLNPTEPQYQEARGIQRHYSQQIRLIASGNNDNSKNRFLTSPFNDYEYYVRVYKYCEKFVSSIVPYLYFFMC